jgi:phage protein U
VGISRNFLGFLSGWGTSTGSYTEEVVSQPRTLFQFSGKPRKTRPATEAEKWVRGEHFGYGLLSM